MTEIAIEKRRRIGNTEGVFMIAIAGAIDGIQFLLNFIPILGWILTALISIFAWLTFFVWFKVDGVGFLEGKAVIFKVASLFGVSILEIIPVLNDLPAWVAFTIIMVILVRAEDTLYNKTGKNIQLQKVIKRMT